MGGQRTDGCGAYGIARGRADLGAARPRSTQSNIISGAWCGCDGNVDALDKKLRAAACPAACWVSV
eukprot:9259596-Pyramimonas_sp.AAC.1